MTFEFDKDYWEQHWQDRDGGTMAGAPPNPYLARELEDLRPGTALDAGCGSGAEAIWLAGHGWQVTAADISAEALTHAAARGGSATAVEWVEADLTTWDPGRRFDLVMTHYAHPAMSQLAFYDRIARWVAPGGTLLIVGHLHTHDSGHGDHPPAEASATAATITARLDDDAWRIVTADEQDRAVAGGHGTTLRDVVVRAERRA
ncbi:class I SAM-dependent methyltransferase [Nocardioides marmoriginsengisoli]|uniref:Class I SAM-dependent methyltransferase n=1 Tax=Nocardioides marmoriginsengisoli TaxID=661483 RepID=A0A3N0CPE1_9ACTN|nr:class I SAM-dependent methyltransferase [Nocardioides marmoriginsengisoli]RNL64906.1 class I SAM-dependent methyltransferase [Nocardioides marmoriginsengisoli]